MQFFNGKFQPVFWQIPHPLALGFIISWFVTNPYHALPKTRTLHSFMLAPDGYNIDKPIRVEKGELPILVQVKNIKHNFNYRI